KHPLGEKRNHPGSKLRQGFWMVFRLGVNNWGLNISHTVNIPRKDGKVIIEVQIDGSIDLPALKEKFEANGIQVEEIVRTSAKVL
ncbi:hypothetical protein V2N30_07160, partial [Streptococcus pneumoniae]